MRAVRYTTIGSGPGVAEVEPPEPGPGQVRPKRSAAGLCHSDWFVMDLPREAYGYGLPLTLGHEGAGTVDALGDGVTGVAVGDAVAVYGPWGCGLCPACAGRGELLRAGHRDRAGHQRGEAGPLAEHVGAHHSLRSDAGAAAAIRRLTGGVGAQAVFDFAGNRPTLEIARQSVAVDGAIEIVGIGGGVLPLSRAIRPPRSPGR